MSIFGKVLVMLNSILLACTALCFAAAEEGAKIFAESCSPCHSAKIRPLDNTHLTKEQWKEAIDRMIDQGAEVQKKKVPELQDYLVSTHGPTSAAPDAGKK